MVLAATENFHVSGQNRPCFFKVTSEIQLSFCISYDPYFHGAVKTRSLKEVSSSVFIYSIIFKSLGWSFLVLCSSHDTLSPQKYLTQIPENEKTPAYPACTHFPHQKSLFSLGILSREACRKKEWNSVSCSSPTSLFKTSWHFKAPFSPSLCKIQLSRTEDRALKYPLWLTEEFPVQHGLRHSNIPMVWPPAASLSSLRPSSLQTCTTYTFLLAKERWTSLSVTVYQQCWHLMHWSLQHSPSCSQQLTTAFTACLLLVMTEKPAPEVQFQPFSKKGSPITIWLQNRTCIFKVVYLKRLWQ